jgi:DNA-directed RNA polymerase subunit D
MIQSIHKTNEKAVFKTDMDTTLANAIRRSVNEIPILAIDEVEIYKNDSALNDQILAHRIGLVPLKNQKLKEDKVIEMKLEVKTGKESKEVVAGEMKGEIVYPDMSLVYLEKGQELEIVAKAKVGKGISHAKYIPGLVFYRHYPKIQISKDGEKHQELAEFYPKIFEFSAGKLKVKNEWECTIDQEDVKDFSGVEIKETGDLIFTIESWGQISPKEIFLEAIKAINNNLEKLSKELK